ncbi:hypothetical protein SAMN02745146_0506 [Hymenobacter daecheongensis DSM 21074]|uniref:PH domain-containing protein n=1 Tax=Hymenobacter daecheongensis DSM 21074 TaxID=1121955 RepID=A0A1M6A5F2_9BACT|nr:hypothetical protein [Hymenobacter daecheongensis]SHI31714.1 hypothetical protein SAMN02745146_0506 [Hymenobacter daecheongensis DSM 21074]
MKLFPFLRPLLEISGAVLAVIFGLRLITGFFTKASRVYRPTFGRQLYLLFWPLLCLGVGLPFLASFFFFGPLSSYELVLLTAVAAVVLGFAGPALALHAQYYVRNLHTTLVFEPKQNILEVYESGVPIPFAKSDLQRVEWVTCASPRLFWSNYNFLRLHLRDGRAITLTALLTNLEPVAGFLRNSNMEPRQRWCCFL